MARPPVVLLHGWGGSFASTWAAHGWVEALAGRGRDLIPVNLPGHAGPASHDPADYDDLAGALDATLPPGPLDAVAFSLGAKLTLALAARRPGRFGRIILGGVGDNLFAPEPAGEMLSTALTDGIGEAASALVRGLVLYAQAGGGEPSALAAVLRRPPNPILVEADLARVGPVMLANGSDDGFARPDDLLREVLPDCTYRAIVGVDHLDLPSAPAFQAVALAFLDG